MKFVFELLMVALLDDLSHRNNTNDVGIFDGTQTMSDCENSTVAWGDLESVLDNLFGFRIQRRCSFIQDLMLKILKIIETKK